MEFHTTFTDIIRGKDVLYTRGRKLGINNFDYNLLPKTSENAIKIAPLLIENINKDQLLIETNSEYYIARDLKDYTVYICFKNLLVIDIDNCRLSQETLVKHFSEMNDTFTIYKSNKKPNNYHVICTSRPFEYRNKDTIKFMLDNYCDYYYSIFSFIRGFCIRLNKKFNEQGTEPSYTLLGEYGQGISRKELKDLCDIYSQEMIKYQDDVGFKH